MIRKVKIDDAAAICEIYNYYVLHTTINFEETAVTVPQMEGRIHNISSSFPWLVYLNDDKIIAYAYAHEWKQRSAYRYAGETTIYLRKGAEHKGIGTTLYKALIDELKKTNLHCIIGGIALPNEASIALHEKLQFKKVAQFKEIGFKLNRWIDLEYWQLLL